jgi:predicted nucleotidyltransferase
VTEGRFDFRRSLETLTRHGVRFVLIGGLAGRLWGSTTVTNDVDVCYERSDENLRRLADALRELGARLRGVDDPVPFAPNQEALRSGDHFTLETDAGSLDLLGTPAGVAGFEALDRNAVALSLDGLTIRIAALDDLIRMKRAAGRPKDRIEIEVLGALRDELDAREPRRPRRR